MQDGPYVAALLQAQALLQRVDGKLAVCWFLLRAQERGLVLELVRQRGTIRDEQSASSERGFLIDGNATGKSGQFVDSHEASGSSQTGNPRLCDVKKEVKLR